MAYIGQRVSLVAVLVVTGCAGANLAEAPPADPDAQSAGGSGGSSSSDPVDAGSDTQAGRGDTSEPAVDAAAVCRPADGGSATPANIGCPASHGHVGLLHVTVEMAV